MLAERKCTSTKSIWLLIFTDVTSNTADVSKEGQDGPEYKCKYVILVTRDSSCMIGNPGSGGDDGVINQLPALTEPWEKHCIFVLDANVILTQRVYYSKRVPVKSM